MKQELHNAIKQAFSALVEHDGSLFGAPIKTDEEDAVLGRKLHEVSINHRLAQHLETYVLPMCGCFGQKLFVDIEFTRRGLDSKYVNWDNVDRLVRPDIIIHNRRNGDEKLNFLVVECKKMGHPEGDAPYQRDEAKIRAFMSDERYVYQYGLRVLYSNNGTVSGTLYFPDNRGQILSEFVGD